MGYSILLVGLGKFGKYYLQTLSNLQPAEIEQPIDQLIVTRTSDVSHWSTQVSKQSLSVICEKVSNLPELDYVLNKYKPTFTAIIAKDKKIGNNIHPHYISRALDYGFVLCEKPFAEACGDGKSLIFFGSFEKHIDNLGMELPYSIIFDKIKQTPVLCSQIFNAKKIRFAWITRGSGNDVIDNLVLHAWSFIPREFNLIRAKTIDNKNNAQLELSYEYAGRSISVQIRLEYGGNFTGFEIDGRVWGIKRTGMTTSVLDVPGSLEQAIALGNDRLNGLQLVTEENILKQNILSALKRKPIIGWERAYESQLFLEQIRGYI